MTAASSATASIGDPVGRGDAGAGRSAGDAFTVTVLGNSGSYPGPGSACSGYLLRNQGFNLWLDAGPGTMANLQTHISLRDVDAVVLSHQHPDHWSDLDGFYVACRWIEPRAQVPIYAPAGLAELLRSDTEADDRTFAWHDITDGTILEMGPFRLAFARTEHPPETLAVRVEATAPLKAFGYSADTGPGWSLEALGLGLDLVICEATFLQDKEGTSPHLSARQAGTTARAAQVKRLLISHIWPIVDPAQAVAEASEAFGGPVECAQVNVSYEL